MSSKETASDLNVLVANINSGVRSFNHDFSNVVFVQGNIELYNSICRLYVKCADKHVWYGMGIDAGSLAFIGCFLEIDDSRIFVCHSEKDVENHEIINTALALINSSVQQAS